MSATAANKSSVGLPSEQLQQWLVWVREDLDRISEHVAYMLGEQARLGEQERLLGQLLQTVAVAESEPADDVDAAVEGMDAVQAPVDAVVEGMNGVEAPVDEPSAEPVADAVSESPSFAQPWMTHY